MRREVISTRKLNRLWEVTASGLTTGNEAGKYSSTWMCRLCSDTYTRHWDDVWAWRASNRYVRSVIPYPLCDSNCGIADTTLEEEEHQAAQDTVEDDVHQQAENEAQDKVQDDTPEHVVDVSLHM